MLATVGTCKFCSSIGAISNPSKRTSISAKRSLSYRFFFRFASLNLLQLATDRETFHVHSTCTCIHQKTIFMKCLANHTSGKLKCLFATSLSETMEFTKKRILSRRKTWQKQWVPNTSDLRTSPQDWSRTNWRLRLLTSLCEGASEEASSQKM